MLRACTAVALIVAFMMFSRPAEATDSSVPFINANVVHSQGFTGQDVTVAVIDSGVYYGQPGLAGGIAGGGTSFINGVQIPDGGADPYGPGHGTYMSLIITDSSGVAPDALILPVRVYNMSDVRLATRYVTERRQTVDPTIRVINLSIGAPGYYGPCSCDGAWPVMAQRVFDAASAGIVTFGATGNESECGGICAPACVSAAVRVAADYDDDYGIVTYYWPGGGVQCGDFSKPYWVTCFSNVAEDCDWFLAAPGYDITVGGFSGDGTSQATAHCSGVAALMFSKAPCGMNGWTARQIIWWNALVYTWGWPYCPLPPEPRHLNAYYAVQATPLSPCIRGDLNCDGVINFDDIDPFVLALSDPAGYTTAYPNCNRLNADINCDGSVDFLDVDPFTECVTLGECPPCP